MSQQSGEVSHRIFCPQYHLQSPQTGGQQFVKSRNFIYCSVLIRNVKCGDASIIINFTFIALFLTKLQSDVQLKESWRHERDLTEALMV